MKPVRYAGLIVAVLALGMIGILPVFADDIQGAAPYSAVAPSPPGNVTLRITDDGILGAEQAPVGGLYLVTVRNDASSRKGIVMTGVDLCCSPYMRFTKVLDPGQEVTFRWYFPSDRTVMIRDLIQCKPMARTCGAPATGSLSSSMQFSQPS